jgi:hypothetical protein
MMKKKILIMLSALFLMMPFGYASAYNGGLLEGKELNVTSMPGGTIMATTDKATDGDLSNYVAINGYDSGTDSLEYEFESPVDIEQIFIKSSRQLTVLFYDSAGVQMGISELHGTQSGTKVSLSQLRNDVSKVIFINSSASVTNLVYEIDLYSGTDTVAPANVTNLTFEDPDLNFRGGLSWDAVTDSDFDIYKIYKNGTYFTQTRQVVYSLGYNNGDVIRITSVDLMGNESSGTSIKLGEGDPDEEPPGDITNLSASPDEESVSFYYNLPTDEDFSHVKIMRNGEVIAAANKTDYFNDTELEPETTYEYTFISVDESGNESAGVSKSVTTSEKFIPLKDISDLKAETEYNRVDLSWSLPNSTEFKHVNIYRDVVEETGFFQTLFFGTMVSAADEQTKIFETNGTYFNDLTVQPETTYEYKLTSQSTTGAETEGVTVETTTTEEPEPDISGVVADRTDNGDFLYKWSDPTEGTVKINVGGNEYKTVPAESGEILIPKEDMKYTPFGDADVSLTPVGVFGTNGSPYESVRGFEKVKMPFSAGELLKSSMGLIGVLGSILLLSLSFMFFPKIRNAIVQALKKRNERRV